MPGWQELVVHLTTHRLLLLQQALSEPTSSKRGLQTNMSYVRQTEFYVGFMRSSPKITLSLGSPTAPASAAPSSSSAGQGVDEDQHGAAEWGCPVCGHTNPIDPHRGQARSDDKCALCGVTYGKSASMGPNGRATPLSSSRPSTPIPRPAPSSSVPPSPSPASMPAPAPTPVTAGTGTERSIACPACTFLNHPSIRNCEICDTPLPRPSITPKPSLPPTSTPALAGTDPDTKYDIVRLSFRQSTGKECYRRLKNVLSDKAWETRPTPTANDNSNGEAATATSRGAGIDGIMQSISLESKAADSKMQDAFKDLEVLMVRAGEMVKLAQSLSAKLPATPQNSQEETLLRTSLVQLGLPTPALTQDMVRDDRLYLEGLAKELGHLLVGRSHRNGDGAEGTGGLMTGAEARGVVGLDEVWVIWMRARGLALLPPATLISILPHLPRFTDPSINLLILPSGLKVLHTPHYSTQALLSRILNRLNPSTETEEKETSVSTIELASIENLAIGMAQELLESVEMARKQHGFIGGSAGIVRDDQANGGTRWYRDLISEWHIEPVR